MESLFGDMPLPAKFLLAFIVVLALIGGVAYLVRRFGAGALTSSALRGRQPRLAVIEATAVDSRRRLVLIRRDNIEHLVMLGGPTDLVVEANIVRGQPAAALREAPRAEAPRPPEPARPAPAAETMWPLAPEPTLRSGRPPERPPVPERPAIPSMSEELPLQPQVEPPPRPPAPDRLASLAAEFSRSTARTEPPAPPTPPAPPGPRGEGRRAPPPAAPPAAPAHEPSADERNLTDIAHRLEAALRRPAREGAEPAGKSEPRGPAEAMPSFARRPVGEGARPPLGERGAFAPRRTSEPARAPAAAPAETPPAEAKEPRAPAPEEQPAAAPSEEAKPQAPVEKTEKPKTVYESLEQEMASLLGRPSGKT
jgi:flagellar biogenesis protein FliO